jgi:YVTN family beta-propeller protein
VACFETNSVAVIDTTTNSVRATVPVGQGPTAVAVNPNGRRAYLTNFEGNSVSVIDTGNNKMISEVPVGSFPQGSLSRQMENTPMSQMGATAAFRLSTRPPT